MIRHYDQKPVTGRHGEGAASFTALLSTLTNISGGAITLVRDDGRHRAAIKAVEESLTHHLFETSQPRREGYVQALTNLLLMVAEGDVQEASTQSTSSRKDASA